MGMIKPIQIQKTPKSKPSSRVSDLGSVAAEEQVQRFLQILERDAPFTEATKNALRELTTGSEETSSNLDIASDILERMVHEAISGGELDEDKSQATLSATLEFERILDRDAAVEAMRIALNASGLSQRKFAEKHDIGLGTLTDILGGRASIDQINLLLQKAGYGLQTKLIQLPRPQKL